MGGVFTDHKSSNRIELSQLGELIRFIKFLVIWPEPTLQPTYSPTCPLNHTPTHGWGSIDRFQIFKQNWIILISSSVIEFLLIQGVPLGGWGGWIGMGCVWVCVWVFHACMHIDAHTYMCMHVHMCGDIPHAPRHPSPTCPLPRVAVSTKHQNSISLELIKIFQFCLKILYL